jgi:hypothetical protein
LLAAFHKSSPPPPVTWFNGLSLPTGRPSCDSRVSPSPAVMHASYSPTPPPQTAASVDFLVQGRHPLNVSFVCGARAILGCINVLGVVPTPSSAVSGESLKPTGASAPLPATSSGNSPKR